MYRQQKFGPRESVNLHLNIFEITIHMIHAVEGDTTEPPCYLYLLQFSGNFSYPVLRWAKHAKHSRKSCPHDPIGRTVFAAFND